MTRYMTIYPVIIWQNLGYKASMFVPLAVCRGPQHHTNIFGRIIVSAKIPIINSILTTKSVDINAHIGIVETEILGNARAKSHNRLS